jgi:hypothetical protein
MGGPRAVELHNNVTAVVVGSGSSSDKVRLRVVWLLICVAAVLVTRCRGVCCAVDGRPYLGIRCVEHLTYGLKGGLGWHDDLGSVYTMSVMLTAGDQYEGGELLLQRERGEHSNPVVGFQNAAFGDGYVFKSTWVHKVSPVRTGNRRVLVLEFWQAPDNPLPKRASHQSTDMLIFSGLLVLLAGLAAGGLFATGMRRVLKLRPKQKAA